MNAKPETVTQRWRRHWRIAGRDKLLHGALLAVVVVVIWGFRAGIAELFDWVGRSRWWNGVPSAARFVALGSLLVCVGGFFLRIRFTRRGLGIVGFSDLIFFFWELWAIVFGILLLIRAAYA